MSNRIRVNSTRQTPNGDRLANAAHRLQDAMSELVFLRDVSAECISGEDYTDMEYEFGLAPGQGSVVYGYVNAIASAANSTAVRNLTTRIGRT